MDNGYVDAFRRCHPDAPGATFPTWNPHIRLDFAFVPERFADRVRSCEVVVSDATTTASDHLPLLIDIDELSG